MTRISLGLGILVVVSLLGARGLAQADGAPPDAAPPDAAPPDAAPADAPIEDARMAEAMERFADAQALFERGDASGALAEMERVYELLEGNPNQYVVLYNLGRVYEELHRYDRAVDYYNRYLSESPADGSDRADAEASLRALERLLGTLRIEANVEGAEIWVDENMMGTAPATLRVPAGTHVVELRAPGHEPSRQEVQVAARTEEAVSVNLAALSDFRGISPAVFASTSAAALVALGVGIGLGVNALSLSDASTACGVTPGCVLDVGARRQEIADFALAADVLYGTAGLFAVTSVVLLFVTDWGGAPASGEATALRAPVVLPVISGEVVGLTIAGAF
jgi:tetratricopeptide (TPR) repeat protein